MEGMAAYSGQCLSLMVRLLLTLLLSTFLALASGTDKAVEQKSGFIPPLTSRSDVFTFLIKIPAPRGLIVDRNGEPLVTNRSAKRLAVRLASLNDANTGEEVFAALSHLVNEVSESVSGIEYPSKEDVLRHWEHRKLFPFPISGALDDLAIADAEVFKAGYEAPLVWQDYFLREYSREPSVSHLIGFVGKSMPDQHGPIGRDEYLTPSDEGRTGLERTYNKRLSGTPGTISILYDSKGRELNREMLSPPVPGETVVMSLNLEMQELAARRLEKTGRHGAFVAIDADTGEILAMVSHPGYDPNEFVPSITKERYLQIADDPAGPLFNRAVTGEYPPGSTFKPIIALAGLQSRMISSRTMFSGPPALDVDGRIFKNWNRNHEGVLDVKFAILRSCNTWFYQAAFRTGDRPIHEAMEHFGIGKAPLVELDTVSSGNHPEIFSSRRGLANVSIGQGAVLVSPLQMASAMGVFATRGLSLRPRLVKQTQAALDPANVSREDIIPLKLPYATEHIDTVRDGMWGVVNYGGGTGQAAGMSKPYVFGKTGTAQWTHGGQERRLAWFTGFVDSEKPRIAFAVLSEGRYGESMSGGGNAAPVIADFLKKVYAKPDQYYVSVPKRHLTSAPNLKGGRAYDSFELLEEGIFNDTGRRNSGIFSIFDQRRPASQNDGTTRRRGGLFSRLFGR